MLQSNKKVQDPIMNKLICRVMVDGKRSKAESIVLSTLQRISKTSKIPARQVIMKALLNVCPIIEVKSLRVGGGAFQVPFPISKSKQLSVGIQWLVKHARGRSGRSMADRLSREIMDASTGQGASVRACELQHKLAQSNRAFAHFRWY
jgi:small subunit ribosomal protein S7